MIRKLALLVILASVQQSYGLKLPNYIKACSRNDKKLGQCATRSAQLAIPHLMNGDRKYRLPKLNPFSITEMNITQGNNLKIYLQNCKIHGLEDTVAKDIAVDVAKQSSIWRLIIPQLIMLCKYEISGRILILPISGKGKANITLDNLDFTYTFKYDVIKREKQEYMHPKKGNIDYTTSRLYTNLENLFNGDRLLGPQTNKFLNENWEELSKDVGPSVTGALAEVIYSLTKNVCQLVPYNEIFPNK